MKYIVRIVYIFYHEYLAYYELISFFSLSGVIVYYGFYYVLTISVYDNHYKIILV